MRNPFTILATLARIEGKVDSLMATEAELQTDLDTIAAAVTKVAALVTSQAATITALQAQLAAGSPVTQAQLDALKAEADTIVAALPATPPAA